MAGGGAPTLLMLVLSPVISMSILSAIAPSFMTLVVGFPISYGGCWLIGLPLHLLFNRLGWRSCWVYLAAGSITCFGLAWLFVAPVNSFDEFFGRMFFEKLVTASILLAGPVAAVTFWSVARPDRAPPPHTEDQATSKA